ncbi:nucleotidyltransferase [Companilactobacillus sp. RD055328]|uniref:nucleotidyltransferase domain-containing protein n=1 Tax=Companilactobacillus sp. RD055328 TaxID=2916634 RepID=UPI001FC8440E|nr:nucleotidyltransferase domain-containing protein [Companilactobacillus sp. RD055328]GKQ42207.1 nucleotidyltransferase [Companilactobacillus sp. RD055328]
MDNINELVNEKVKEIEANENVKVLLAVESGSRAWGFDSPDSDYDVRFIYKRNETDYLRLEGIRDVIEWQLDDTLDISGWDIQKSLRLLYRSNPTLFEWFNSDVVYYQTEEINILRDILPQFFSKKKSLYHYLNMARTNNKQSIQNGDHMISIKKYFYVLRAILACQWIIEKNTNPPMKFTDLVNNQLTGPIKEIITDLLDKKMNVPELKMIKKNPELDKFITDNLISIEDIIKGIPENNNDWQLLNDTFVRLIREA